MGTTSTYNDVCNQAISVQSLKDLSFSLSLTCAKQNKNRVCVLTYNAIFCLFKTTYNTLMSLSLPCQAIVTKLSYRHYAIFNQGTMGLLGVKNELDIMRKMDWTTADD